MTTVGIPARKIGTATSVPGDAALGLGSLGYRSFASPQPSYTPLSFNFNTDLNLLRPSTPQVTASTSLDIKHFVNYGHKIIWYHGLERSWAARSRHDPILSADGAAVRWFG